MAEPTIVKGPDTGAGATPGSPGARIGIVVVGAESRTRARLRRTASVSSRSTDVAGDAGDAEETAAGTSTAGVDGEVTGKGDGDTEGRAATTGSGVGWGDQAAAGVIDVATATGGSLVAGIVGIAGIAGDGVRP